MAKIKQDTRPLGSPRSWAKTIGGMIAGQAAIDGADVVALAMEERWGAGRLRLLVPTELREKFDRQRFRFNSAIWHGDLEQVRAEAGTDGQGLEGSRRGCGGRPCAFPVARGLGGYAGGWHRGGAGTQS